MVQSCGHHTGIAFTARTEAMTRQHHSSFTQSIFSSAKRVFRSNKDYGMLTPADIDARTARDIGINLVGLH
jgi:2-keto-3-deoxy-L-rhamnonate aldolase RhmA